MNNQDKVTDIIKKLTQVTYLANGEYLEKEIKDKQVYSSGQITGKKNYKDLFLFAEELVRLGGATEVFNPVVQIPENYSHKEAIKCCMSVITEFDTIIMLPGWDESKGATTEHNVALACGMNVVHLASYDVINYSYNALDAALARLL